MTKTNNKKTKNNKANKTKSKPTKLKSFMKYTLLTLFVIASIATIGFSLFATSVISDAPPINAQSIIASGDPTRFYDDKGELIGTQITSVNKLSVSFDKLPKYLRDAVIAIEDERFYKHPGIDVKRIVGSALSNVKSKLSGSDLLQGGSTLTQQLIKNKLFMDQALNNVQPIKRKILEIYYAIDLEKQLSKEQILLGYLNTVNFGGLNEGIGAASSFYFNKPVEELSLIESAFLAGLPQSPGYLYPFNEKFEGMENSKLPYVVRTKIVLGQMELLEYISKEEYDASLADLNANGIKFNKTNSEMHNEKQAYEHFINPALDQVKKDLATKYNYDEKTITNLISSGGLKIYTTMNKRMQDSSQAIIDDDKNFWGSLNSNVTENGTVQPQGSATIVDYHTGEVKVLIGGRHLDTLPPQAENRAVSIYRQPGSSIKPLTAYAPAIEEGLITPGSIFSDKPLSPAELASTGYQKQPTNWYDSSGGPKGDLTLRGAIKISSNLTSIRAVDKLTSPKAYEYAQKLGLDFVQADSGSVAATALGEPTIGTSALKMASAFGTFGNEGLRIEPKLYTKVTDRDGIVLLEPKTETVKVFSPETAWLTYDLLRAPLSGGGTGTAANFNSAMNVVGKTGTSENSRTLSFVGLTPYYSGSLYIFNDKTGSINANSNAIANAWGKMMSAAHEGLPGKAIPKPANIVSATICAESGLLPNEVCIAGKHEKFTENFKKGTVPTKGCDKGPSPEELAKKKEEEDKKKTLEEEKLKKEQEDAKIKKEQEDKKKKEEEEKAKDDLETDTDTGTGAGTGTGTGGNKPVTTP